MDHSFCHTQRQSTEILLLLIAVLHVLLQVELQVTSLRVVSRAAALPFELMDAARSEVRRMPLSLLPLLVLLLLLLLLLSAWCVHQQQAAGICSS